MSTFRSTIADFQLGNPLYSAAQVTFYTIDEEGEATTTLATLYASPTSAVTAANPQILDADGKFAAPVYTEVPVIAQVVAANVGSHTTGVINNRGTYRGDWVTGTAYYSTDFIKDSDTSDIYIAVDHHVSGATIAADVTAGHLELVLQQAALSSGIFLDTNFLLKDNSDLTKRMDFQLSGITTATTRTLTVPDASGTLALSSSKLSAFAATTSAELAGVISDETGLGALVFANTPTLVTPTLGAATATSVNKVAITAPASAATLTVADGKTLTASNTLTFAGTDSTTITFQATDTYVGRTTTDTLTNKTLTTPTINGATCTGTFAFASGSVLNFASSDVTITHSADTLTLAGGVLVLPNSGLKINSLVFAAADAGFDVLYGWDDSANTYKNFALADFTNEGAPAAGDYLVMVGAEGDMRRVNWSSLPGFGGGLTNVADDTDPALGGPLDANTFSIWFDTNTGIFDQNGNEALLFVTTASAVNELRLANAATGGNPKFTATGGDTDVGIDHLVKGAGKFNFLATTSGPAEIRLFEDADNGSNYVGLIAPASMASNFTLTLPGVTATLATLDGTETFSNKTLTAPKIASGGFIADANGNELVIYTTTASAINEVTYANAAAGNNPKYTATGGDTDVGLDFLPKAAGKFRFLATTSGPAEIRLFEDADNGTNYAGIIAPASLAGDITLTLPSSTGTLALTSDFIGKQCVPVPAASMYGRTTNGAATGSVEMTTNKNMFITLDFDTTTQEFAQFAIVMPDSWDESTISFQPVWSHAATSTNFGVVWQLAAVATSDDDAGDVAFGTAQTSTDTGGTTNDIYIGPESSAITVAGTPQAGDYVMFQVARAPANGSDTMAIDARLHAIKLFITTAAGHD